MHSLVVVLTVPTSRSLLIKNIKLKELNDCMSNCKVPGKDIVIGTTVVW